jgi:predicted short-subunit dehydrogenase-like oxidoreductase (DUF2520 family)
MKIAVLGSGNVATHLSKALIKAGHQVLQVWSRKTENAVNLASEIGANPISDVSEINDDVDFVVIAVSDDAIESVAANIPNKGNRLIIHTSGTTSIDVLQKFANHFGVLYPLQTFSKSSEIDFSQVPLFIEANSVATLELLNKLGYMLSTKVYPADSETRASLHISAVFACNFTNHLYTIAQQILKEKGLSFDLLRPLIKETVDKVLLNSPFEAQTGPAKRNDTLIINKHVELLNLHPRWQDIYQLISQDIVKMHHQPKAVDK